MTTLLLDSGVWLAAMDDSDRFHGSSAELVRGAVAGRSAAALDLTLYEVANVATVRWKAPGDAELLLDLIHTAVAKRLIRFDHELAARTVAVASAEGLTAYDGAYVACARKHGWSLVSTDVADLVSARLAQSPDQALAAL